jgi:hypothetical protein
LTVRELSLPWAHHSFARNPIRIKLTVTGSAAGTVYGSAAKPPSLRIIPSAVTAAIVAARRSAAGPGGKRIDVTGQASRAKPAVEPKLAGIASVFESAARSINRLASLARAIRSPKNRAREGNFSARGQVATNGS